MITLITSEAQLAREMATKDFHMHCLNGCEKSAGQWAKDGALRCAFCDAPFVPCTEEICAEHKEGERCS